MRTSVPQTVSSDARSPLTVAVAQPPCVPTDVGANARAHADAVRAAQARIVAFPELSLTGYVLEAPALSPEDPALASLVEACGDTGAVALAGAPVAGEDGRLHIAVLRIDAGGAEVAYRKSHLGGDEPRRFSPGDGATAIEIDGWRVGLGVCKDTGVARHVEATAALRVDLYVAGLVHRPDELDEQERRGVAIARACDAHVAFASFAGPAGDGYGQTAGRSAIWAPDGTALRRAGQAPGDVARASLEPVAA